MFLKNNKYRELIIAVVITIVLGILAYKLLEYTGVVTGVLGKILSLSISFIYGIIIAYILNPIVKLFEKKVKVKRAAAIGITYAIFILILSIICIFGIPSLVESIKDIASDIPGYITSIQNYINTLMENENIREFINSTGIFSNIEMYINKIGSMTMNVLEGSFSTIFTLSSQVIKIVLGLLISIYVLIDKDRLITEWKRILFLIFKEKKAKKIIEFGRIYHEMIGTYIGIKAIDSSIIGGMAFVLLTIVKSEYALLLAIIVGISNMIPYFGPFIGEVVGFLINVFVSPTKGIVVFLVLFSLQMFDGWYLDPKLIGGKVGVRPFWIIYAVVIGGGFFGPIGMLLASPTAATIKIYYTRLLERKKDLLINVEKS